LRLDDQLPEDDTEDPLNTTDLGASRDPFNRMLLSLDFSASAQQQQGQQQAQAPYVVVKVDRELLRSMRKEDVYIVRWPQSPHVKPRFFKNMFPKKGIVHCTHCNCFFDEESYEFESLKLGSVCPFCRKRPELAATAAPGVDGKQP
jgi:hypothetical protein